ncbi:hypothetical protein [Lamprocystis purpurea]|uniref:hypothetical protein n=1 Tax=Lamprocystis purpurea TaxID=61598 RepID=UPI00146F6412|nr:hypothetical protein [Lamprocystis purpurea]
MKFSEIIRTIKTIIKNFRDIGKIQQTVIFSEIERLQKIYARDGASLIPYGRKSYSQNDEDGIIEEIFRRIGHENKRFVEIGIGDGKENNTLALLLAGWKGLWIDMNAGSIKDVVKNWAGLIDSTTLTAIAFRVDAANIDRIIADAGFRGEVDLLSIDIDGNDAYIFEAIKCISPRCVVIEYNAKFGPTLDYCIPYSQDFEYDGTDAFGSSLKHLQNVFSRRGYSLVGCNLAGVNAFFVRSDLVTDKFIQPYTAEVHYQPPRYHLSGYVSGHPSSFRVISGI